MLTQSVADLTAGVRAAFVSHFAKLEAEWDAGDWREALTEFSAEGADDGGQRRAAARPGDPGALAARRRARGTR